MVGERSPCPGPITMSVMFRLAETISTTTKHEAHRDLVAHHLRRGAQRAEEGVLRVRGPAGDDHAVDLDRGDRHQEQQAGVDVGQRDVGAERNHRPGGQRRHDGHDRAEEEQALVGRRREDDFLEQQLDRVGDRLQQAERADAVGAGADLRPADRLALPQRQVGDAAHQRQHHRDDLDQRPDAPARPSARVHQVRRRSGPGRSRRSGRSCRRPRWRRARRRCRGSAPAARHRPSVAATARGAPIASRAGRCDGASPARLQRGRAAHSDRRVDRHVGDARAAPAAAPCAAAASSAPRGGDQHLGAHDFEASKPGRPSRLPSTRSTFQAGRVSPSGLTTPWKLCTRPSALTKVPEVSVNGAIGSSTSANVEVGLERGQRDDHLGLRQRRRPRRRRRPSRAPARCSAAAAPSAPPRQHLAGVQAAVAGQRADELRADGVGGFGQVADAWRRSARRSSWPAPAARRPADAARRRCRAGWPCARRQQRRGDRLARRRSALPCGRRRDALGRADRGGDVGQRLQPSRSARRRCCVRHRHQPVVVARACRLVHLARRLRAAWRRRCANSGWSLRRNEPMTSARCSCDSEAIEVPSQRDALDGCRSRRGAGGGRCSRCRGRAPAWPAGAAPRRVLCGLTSAPMLCAPCSALICFRPLATYSSAVCQSTVCHSPPCLIIGAVRRSVAVQRLVREAVAVGEPAFVDVFVLERHHAHHLVALDLDDQVGAGRVVRADALAARQLPGAGAVAERLAGERADRADVDHVARQLGVDRVADERS